MVGVGGNNSSLASWEQAIKLRMTNAVWRLSGTLAQWTLKCGHLGKSTVLAPFALLSTYL